MASGALHQLQYHASLQSAGSLNGPAITMGKNVSSTTNLSGTAGSAIQYHAFFTATSANAGSVNLSAQPGTKVGFDNVSVKQINGYSMARTSDWASVVYASTKASKVVDCAALGWAAGCQVKDTNGNAVALPFTLPAGTAKLLLRADTVLRRN